MSEARALSCQMEPFDRQGIYLLLTGMIS